MKRRHFSISHLRGYQNLKYLILHTNRVGTYQYNMNRYLRTSYYYAREKDDGEAATAESFACGSVIASSRGRHDGRRTTTEFHENRVISSQEKLTGTTEAKHWERRTASAAKTDGAKYETANTFTFHGAAESCSQHAARAANSVCRIVERGDGSPVSKHMVVENNITAEGATRETAVRRPFVRSVDNIKTKFDDDATVINKIYENNNNNNNLFLWTDFWWFTTLFIYSKKKKNLRKYVFYIFTIGIIILRFFNIQYYENIKYYFKIISPSFL